MAAVSSKRQIKNSSSSGPHVHKHLHCTPRLMHEVYVQTHAQGLLPDSGARSASRLMRKVCIHTLLPDSWQNDETL